MSAAKKQQFGKPFQPGQSGNPSGRQKLDDRHVQVLAKQHTTAAVMALVAALKSPRERVPAAIALLDRGWGKPVQMIAADPERPIAIEFQWSDAAPLDANGSVISDANGGKSTPSTQTRTAAVQTIEGAIVEAAQLAIAEATDDE